MGELSSVEELLETDQDWYTPKEVGVIFRVDPKTVVRWETTGRLQKLAVKVIKTPGGHRRYFKQDIDRVYYDLNPQVRVESDSES